MWHTWFLLQSCIVYVTEFIGKVCLPLKTLADWKTSGSATCIGYSQWSVLSQDEIAGDRVDAKAVRRHSTMLLMCRQTQNLTWWSKTLCSKSWKESWLRSARGCWETGIWGVPWQPGSCSQPISVERLPKPVKGARLKVPNEFQAKFQSLGLFYLPWGSWTEFSALSSLQY